MLKDVLEMDNIEFEQYLLNKYGKVFNIIQFTNKEFERFEKTADPMVANIMRNLRAS